MTRQNTTVQQTPLLRNSTNYQAFVHPPQVRTIPARYSYVVDPLITH